MASGSSLRSTLDPQLRFSFGGAMTVFRITKADAEQVTLRLVRGEGRKQATGTTKGGEAPVDPTIAADVEAHTNIVDAARDEIRAHISRRFKGHALARLVAAVLEAQGYTVATAPEGADRGVDIVAGRGPLGFEEPRLVVQVKSGDDPTDAATIRQLQGAMAITKAQHGLFVAWGGYKTSLSWGATLPQHFDVRLWTGDDLIGAIQACYDSLAPDIQAEIPLKRVWILVRNEDE
jgi:restriction system protein